MEPESAKSSVDEIRNRFTNEIAPYADLATGQTSFPDAALVLDLVGRCAAAVTPNARQSLDVGCGPGNYTLKLLQHFPDLEVTLLDLTPAMLATAEKRVRPVARGPLHRIEGDVRAVDLGAGRFDVITAGAVLHHLRGDDEWEAVFTKLYRALRPGGSLWVADLIDHAIPGVQRVLWERYGDYVATLPGGTAYRDELFARIAREDTPRPLAYQLDLLRRVGFRQADVLHKSTAFAAFGAVK